MTDEATVIRCAAGEGLIREEVSTDASGKVIRWNLALINFGLFSKDNGRVLGYDTAHRRLHRHFAGAVTTIEAAPYNEAFDRFIAEVDELKKREEL
ncbi:MAG: hypothetical protein WBC92_00965 [Terracidiphilus sp.]